MNLGLSAALGFIIAAALLVLVRRRRIEPFSGLFMAIVTTIGLAEAVGLQSLLASLTLGVVLGNAGREGEEMIDSLENLEPLLLTCFFTLAGVDLDLSRLLEVGLLGGAYFAARAVGKVAGGAIGAAIGSESPRIRRNLGPALLPQAGLAIGMVVILQGNANIASELKLTITNVVLAAVVLNEILGPPLVRRAIHRAGEAGKDRRRVVEFLQEENIRTPMRASDRWDAIRQLAEFLVRSHDLKHIKVAELVRTIEEREREFTTALGMGVALPHARVPRGPEIMGVMGIFPEGVDFGAADGEPARVVILIATPEGREDHHLEVMAAVTRIVSDAGVRARLFAARTSADAFEAIEMDLEHDYNYFLEEA
jgi:mannitol/fructose-specific phosphotransferase system IIA component (Ntr-type)